MARRLLLIDRLGRTTRQTRRVGAFVILGVAVVAVLALITLAVARAAVRGQLETRATDNAALSAQLLQEQSLRLTEGVRAYARELRGVRPRGARLSALGAARADEVLAALNESAGVAFSFFVAPDGRVVRVLPPDPAVIGKSFAFRDWYSGVRTRSPYVSRAYRTAAFGRPKVVAVAATVGGRRRPRGILVAAVRGRTQRFVDLFARRAGVELTVTDQGGTLVARSNRPSERLVALAGEPGVAAALRGRPAFAEREEDGRGVLSAYAPVRGAGWTVRADVSRASVAGELSGVRLAVVTLAVLFAVVLTALTLLLARTLSRVAAQQVTEQLVRGLLPHLEIAAPDLRVSTLYRPHENRQLVGGDFHDAIELEDGSLSVVIGDVAGHGPEAAALGAGLRVAWRSHTLAGSDPLEAMRALDATLRREVEDDFLFATACCVRIDGDRQAATVVLAGHPPPLMLTPGRDRVLQVPPGLLLGLDGDPGQARIELPTDVSWGLFLYTDGLVEGRASPGSPERYGEGRLRARVARIGAPEALDRAALEGLVSVAEAANGGPLGDDVALLAVARSSAGPPAPGARDRGVVTV